MKTAIKDMVDKLRDMAEKRGDSAFTAEILEAIDRLENAYDRIVEMEEAVARTEEEEED